jgi:hypothetical protein
MLQGRTRNATLHRVLLAVVACGWVLLGPVAVGGGNDSDPPNPYRVLLHSREFVPKADVAKHLRSGERRGVLQFTELPGEERHVELQASGIVLHDYLPNLAYAATLGPSVNAHDLALLGVRAWFPLEPNDRLSADLRHGRIGAWARPAKHLVDVVILRYPDFAQDDAARAVAALGGVVLSTAEPFEQLTARLPMHDLRELARESWVLWIEAVPPPFVANNDRSRQSINVDAVQVPPYSLSGPGVRIAVFEDGSISHPDLAGRVTNHAVNLSAHATHVAGTLAGDGALSGGLLRGMAPKALLFAWTYVPPANVFASMLTSVTTEKTVISNNSWGANIGNAFNNCHLLGNYGAEANIFDRLVRNNKFATYKSAGNARTTLCAPLTYGTIDLTATAKNAVIVGATLRPAPNTADSTAYFSGWGPTDDGRLKPDVVAVGYPVKSTCLSFSYCELSGTSQATPAVSGTAALLMESYRNTHDNRDPSPELVKAILLNTAVDIGPAGPDFQSGYGKVDALRAVNTVRDERFLNGSVGPSQSRVINLTERGESAGQRPRLEIDQPERHDLPAVDARPCSRQPGRAGGSGHQHPRQRRTGVGAALELSQPVAARRLASRRHRVEGAVRSAVLCADLGCAGAVLAVLGRLASAGLWGRAVPRLLIRLSPAARRGRPSTASPDTGRECRRSP